MHSNFPKYLGRVSFFWLASVSISLLVVVEAFGQRPAGRPTPPSDANDPINQERANRTDLRNREWLLESNRKPVRKPGLGPQQSAAPQIKEDFERIQLINREMIKTVLVDNVVDDKQILKTVGEIRKRAARLRANLAYPEPEGPYDGNTTPPSGDAVIKVLLARLDGSIVSFVTNPIFQLKQRVVQADLASKASRDLRDVMEHSDMIRKMLKERR